MIMSDKYTPIRKNSVDNRLYSLGLVLNLFLCIVLFPMFWFGLTPLIFGFGIGFAAGMNSHIVLLLLLEFIKYWGVPIVLLFVYKLTKRWLEANRVHLSVIILIFALLISATYLYLLFTWDWLAY